MIEPLLLTTSRVSTFFGTQPLTGASGFFFERDERLYLVTNRHVLIDKPSGHLPNRIEIEVHTDADNLTRASVLSVALDRDGKSIWHQGRDSAGDIDVAAIEGQGNRGLLGRQGEQVAVAGNPAAANCTAPTTAASRLSGAQRQRPTGGRAPLSLELSQRCTRVSVSTAFPIWSVPSWP